MKRLFFSFLFLSLALVMNAQSESEHLTFKGVPIDGTEKEFFEKLKALGYVPDSDSPNILRGKFAGHSNCKIFPLCNDKGVYAVGVIVLDSDNWELLSTTYNNLKMNLTIKYGLPTKVREEFTYPDAAEDDRSKLYEMKMGRGYFQSTFETNKGTVMLSILEVEHIQCFVSLSYVDKINSSTSLEEILDDL